MIGYLCGILLDKQINDILLEIGGIGYEVHVPLNVFSELPSIGEKVNLYIHQVVREDGHYLYGFLKKEQRNLFRKLIKVSGIGPKLGVVILSGMEPNVFANYILNNDTSALVKLPGIGKKMAQRLVVEIKDKLSIFDNVSLGDGMQINPVIEDTISALITLGYKRHEAVRAVSVHKGKDISSEEMIRLVLQEIHG